MRAIDDLAEFKLLRQVFDSGRRDRKAGNRFLDNVIIFV